MNLDTNQINQAVDVAKDIHAQAVTSWPAICAFAVVVARELRNFNLWCLALAEWVIGHGGIGMLIKKLCWNPKAVAAASVMLLAFSLTGCAGPDHPQWVFQAAVSNSNEPPDGQ